MPFSTLDLNLLRVFDAIMAERSVVRASQKVHLTQSAVSHSLARLRETLGDELFVRTPSGMQPTPRALELSQAVRESLRSLEAIVDRTSFDPALSRRTFTLAANDFTTLLIIPELMRILRTEAPNIDLIIKPVTRIDLAEQIDLGGIDAAIGSFSSVPPRFESAYLFAYDDVLISSSRHGAERISLEDLTKRPIVVVSFGGEREGAVDGFIAERGLARRSEMYDRTSFEQALAKNDAAPRIVLSVPHFLALPPLIAMSEFVALIPRPLARAFAEDGGVRVCELPYSTRALEVRMLWHQRNEAAAAHMWLHEVVRRASDSVK